MTKRPRLRRAVRKNTGIFQNDRASAIWSWDDTRYSFLCPNGGGWFILAAPFTPQDAHLKSTGLGAARFPTLTKAVEVLQQSLEGVQL